MTIFPQGVEFGISFSILLVDPAGRPLARSPDSDIPHDLIAQLHELRYGAERMSLEDAATVVCPYPFRRDAPESLLDKLPSIVATYKFRATIDYWRERRVDFSTYLYIPEVDPVTSEERHDRGDHNHLFQRAASSIRQGKDPSLNFEAFDDVIMDSLSGLTHASLIGKRKQSLVDAERLISSHVSSLLRHGHHQEARHIEVLTRYR